DTLRSIKGRGHDPEEVDGRVAYAPEPMHEFGAKREGITRVEDVFLAVNLEPELTGNDRAAFGADRIVVRLVTRRSAGLDGDADDLNIQNVVGRQQLLHH